MLILLLSNDSTAAARLGPELAGHGLDWTTAWTDQLDTALHAAPSPEVLVCADEVGASRGLRLLEQLRVRHPDAVRILLIDPGHDQDALQGMEVAHRLLPDPLDAAALIDAVQSVSGLRTLLDHPMLKRATAQIGSLPTAPRLYLQLTRLLRDPDASVSSIVEVVGSDPAVAAKVLRLTNSAYYSKGREISDLRAAVARLGQTALCHLVLASEVFSTGSRAGEAEAMRARALRISQLAGRMLPGPLSDLAATAGLLAEVGLLLPPIDSSQGEDALPHTLAGAYLLGLWGLPSTIVEAVAYHQTPHAAGCAFGVTGVVHVAAALVNGSEVDEDYLRAVSRLDDLPAWRALAEALQEDE